MNMKSLYLGIAAVFAIGFAGSAQSSVITTVMSTSVPVEILDLKTVTSTLNFTGHGSVLDVDALIDITHSFDADLVLSLSHGGKTIVLSSRQGGAGGQDYTNTVFDDSAQDSIDAAWVYAPYTGIFRPMDALSAFFGQDVFGEWKLIVTDSEIGDAGTINRFGITATAATAAAAVPEPGSLALFGLGLMGLVGLRRKS